ncbi:UNVERIFIED_CONTAM: hypothetical protein Sindi_1821800 [Sesamum indicum]
MWLNGYYFQSQVFYNGKWTREMEDMFVQSLMDLKRLEIFRAAANNMHAVHSAIYDVNKAFGSRITYSWGYSLLDKLPEDGVRDKIFKEKKLARCYINAYEPNWDELYELFDDDENDTIWISDDEEDVDDPFGANPGWVDPPVQ